MKNLLLLFLIPFFCCNDVSKKNVLKDYSLKNAEALTFCKAKSYNEDFYFLLDLSIHPGKNRFFVYDFKQKKITDQNLVTHGSCDVFEENKDKWEKAKFSPKNDSHCSMKGKYKIGKRDYSSWGCHVKYWLDGLENSNKNAVERVVVLHSWEAVSNTEVYPEVTALSWGCPAVSLDFFAILDAKLKEVKKPVLLWIIE